MGGERVVEIKRNKFKIQILLIHGSLVRGILHYRSSWWGSKTELDHISTYRDTYHFFHIGPSLWAVKEGLS